MLPCYLFYFSDEVSPEGIWARVFPLSPSPSIGVARLCELDSDSQRAEITTVVQVRTAIGQPRAATTPLPTRNLFAQAGPDQENNPSRTNKKWPVHRRFISYRVAPSAVRCLRSACSPLLQCLYSEREDQWTWTCVLYSTLRTHSAVLNSIFVTGVFNFANPFKMIKSVERAQMLKQLSRLLLASNGAASQMHNMPAKCRVVAGMQKRLSSSFANPNGESVFIYLFFSRSIFSTEFAFVNMRRKW